MPFCNPNGIPILHIGIIYGDILYGVNFQTYRSGYKKSQISEKNLEIESIDPRRSKTVLRIFFRPLVQILGSNFHHIDLAKSTIFSEIWQKSRF